MTAQAIGGPWLGCGINGDHRTMAVGMAAKIGGMAIGAGGGGIAVTEHGTVRIKANTGHMREVAGIGAQAGGSGMAGLTEITMNGQGVAGRMLVAVGAGCGIAQKGMGRQSSLEALNPVMTVGAFQGLVVIVLQAILGPMRGVGMADLADTLTGGLLIGKTALIVEGVGIEKGYLSVY